MTYFMSEQFLLVCQCLTQLFKNYSMIIITNIYWLNTSCVASIVLSKHFMCINLYSFLNILKRQWVLLSAELMSSLQGLINLCKILIIILNAAFSFPGMQWLRKGEQDQVREIIIDVFSDIDLIVVVALDSCEIGQQLFSPAFWVLYSSLCCSWLQGLRGVMMML
jgi:hypothetical protein